MPDYQRWYYEGGTYFFTVVTEQRIPLFSDPMARKLLGQAFRNIAQTHPFETIAMVLLPDHLHTLWKMPRNDSDFSTRWKLIKSEFSREWRLTGGREAGKSISRQKRGSCGVWQRRFWEHLIRNEADLEAHFDYVYYNPGQTSIGVTSLGLGVVYVSEIRFQRALPPRMGTIRA